MREFINFFAKVSHNIPAHSARGAAHCVTHPHFGAMSHTHRSENTRQARGRGCRVSQCPERSSSSITPSPTYPVAPVRMIFIFILFTINYYTAVCGKVERTVVVNFADQMVGLAAGIIG